MKHGRSRPVMAHHSKKGVLKMTIESNLRIAEFAKRVGYEVSTIRKKIYRREIDSIKVGRLVLVPESEVDRLLADYRPRVDLQA